MNTNPPIRRPPSGRPSKRAERPERLPPAHPVGPPEPATALSAPSDLTPRQRAILDFIRRFIAETDIPPTVREIMGHFGGDATVKYIHPTPHGLRLLPANPDFAPIDIDGETSEIHYGGPVVAMWRTIRKGG